MNKHEKVKSNRHAELVSASRGRSMVEMLGVLAIIGVLSIGGLAGYKIAMNYHRANETIHDVMLRATNVPMKWDDYATKTCAFNARPVETRYAESGNTTVPSGRCRVVTN